MFLARRIGGPIKKNRLFYFLNYEGRRDASDATAVRVVPNMLFRQGIFTYENTSGILAELTPAQIQQIDPQHIGESQPCSKSFSHTRSRTTNRRGRIKYRGVSI